MTGDNYSKKFATLCRNKSKKRYKICDIQNMHETTEVEICKAISVRNSILFLVAYKVIEYCKK